jgi:hypothetical protein
MAETQGERGLLRISYISVLLWTLSIHVTESVIERAVFFEMKDIFVVFTIKISYFLE